MDVVGTMPKPVLLKPATGAIAPAGGKYGSKVPIGVKEMEMENLAASPGSNMPSGEATGVEVPAKTSIQPKVISACPDCA